jgi:two-component system chemotaxis response regulator CheY
MTARRIAQLSEPDNAPAGRQSDHRQHILVVDDDPSIRDLNTELLQRCGYHVDAARDGVEALMAIQAGNYDLLVTDYNMPKLNGVELIKKLHAARLMLPVIMVTGEYPQTELDRHPEFQIDACLLKPYNFDELLAVVKNVLHAHAGNVEDQVPPPNWMSQSPPTGLDRENGSP